MTFSLHNLSNGKRGQKKRKLKGRGPGSGLGKTSGRGMNGAGSRSGYKRRHGAIGGGVPLHQRVPTRGFSNAQFARRPHIINLELIERVFNDGETVNVETIKEKGIISGKSHGLKVLGKGTLTKKVNFQIEAISAGAKEKLEKAGITIELKK